MQVVSLLVGLLVFLSASPGQQARRPAAPSASPKVLAPAIDKGGLEKYVRHLFVWGEPITVVISDPKPSTVPGLYDVQVKASAGAASITEALLVSADGRKIVRGSVYDLRESPFQKELAKLSTAGAPSFGPDDAPATLIVFSDFQCSYCKEEAKLLRQNLPGAFPKEVKVVFKDYPLEQIHPWARTAAIAGRCIAKQDMNAFWTYHDWIFEHQGELAAENAKDKIVEYTKTTKLEPIGLAGCMESRTADAEVSASIAEGRSLNVDSTPTVFLNGRRLVGHQNWQQLKQLVEHEVAYRHACCEVKLPTPLKQNP